MSKYICSQCTGRSGEEHTFHLSQTPKACPYNGCPERYIKSIETYLREQLEDAEWEAERWEDKYYELKEKQDGDTDN
ncbi:hypothetical protein M199_gp169 [Halogranum tailed virus 1]|uniref:Uncharacterized protein n=1 Tax=Halogranum tailed virus 1 TaxID=1273749 RepID=R4TLD7_9CAUD|nr:hypothetical protein M199_gp169 [Halogranum tailed virus 1]AGM11497.1 hypothetical protein HGTV1_200 [Halogranum tailed virus 1]